MESDSVYEYSTPVHQVLFQPRVLMGIGVVPAMLIIIFTICLANISVLATPIGIALLVAAKAICKKDPFMLEILFERLLLPNVWRAG